MQVDTAGMPLVFQRSYVSSVANKNLYGQTAMGPGWRHTYSEFLTFKDTESPPAHANTRGGETNTIIYETALGNRYRFTKLGNGQFLAAPGVRASLTQSGATYLLTLPDQQQREFNAAGRLTKLRDGQGRTQTITLTHTENGMGTIEPTLVRDDTTGRTLTLAYHPSNGGIRLISVTNDQSNQVTFGY